VLVAAAAETLDVTDFVHADISAANQVTYAVQLVAMYVLAERVAALILCFTVMQVANNGLLQRLQLYQDQHLAQADVPHMWV
jgi:hypothetical protein